MGLKITDFYSMRPKLPFRFKTDWFTGLLNKDDVLSYCVTSISIPKPEIENTLGFSTFGNAFVSMPTFSPGHRRLDITFEETDDMYVIQFLDELLKSGDTLAQSRVLQIGDLHVVVHRLLA